MRKKRKGLTRHQQTAYRHIAERFSNDWFTPRDLYMVKRPDFTCQLLEEKGALISKVNPVYKGASPQTVIRAVVIFGDFTLYKLNPDYCGDEAKGNTHEGNDSL